MSVEWMERALCAQVGGDWWFPEKGDNSKPALAVCGACPVTAQCLAFSETLPPGVRQHGIWGGKSPTQRKLTAPSVTCRQCAQPFTPTAKGQKLCSDDCRTQSRKDTYAKSYRRSIA